MEAFRPPRLLRPPFRYLITLCDGVDKTLVMERLIQSHNLTDVEDGGPMMFSAEVPEDQFWYLASDRSVARTQLEGLLDS